MATTDGDLKRTPLHGLHVELGARLVPFAGYEMPVQYPNGIIAEHQHTRAAAGLFDVSHMGQVTIAGDDAAAAFEALVPADVQGLAVGATRYSFFTNAQGGILDDLMITRTDDGLFVIVNAACKDADLVHMRQVLEGRAEVRVDDGRALLALQGPQAAAVLSRFVRGIEAAGFMTSAVHDLAGVPCRVSRSGYTGEDGFEISLPADQAEAVARRLLDEPEVMAIGLGARDSLRLEAGLCLYGHDIDGTTTPVEAGLTWAIQKRRRAEGGFPGAEVILKQIAEGPPRRRVGIRPEGRAPVREGAQLLTEADGKPVGHVTSGGFGPTVGGPVAMGYLPVAAAGLDAEVWAMTRGKAIDCRVVKLPFTPHNYYRGA